MRLVSEATWNLFPIVCSLKGLSLQLKICSGCFIAVVQGPLKQSICIFSVWYWFPFFCSYRSFSWKHKIFFLIVYIVNSNCVIGMNALFCFAMFSASWWCNLYCVEQTSTTHPGLYTGWSLCSVGSEKKWAHHQSIRQHIQGKSCSVFSLELDLLIR